HPIGGFCVLTKPPPPGSPRFPSTTLFGSARLDDVNPEERVAVRWLAVLGPGFVTHELHEIAGIDLESALISLSQRGVVERGPAGDRKSTRLNSSHVKISYAVFCLEKN